MTDFTLTLAVGALILAVTAFCGFVGLLVSVLRRPEPRPPSWVNHGATRRTCER